MDSDHFDALTRGLVSSPSRRRVAGALSGFVLGVISGLPHLLVTDAKNKHNKKKRRRRRRRRRERNDEQPFCAEKNACVDGLEAARCDDGSGEFNCYCFVTAETDEPLCAVAGSIAACSECAEIDAMCIDASGPACDGPTGCAFPCPKPL